MYIYIHSHIFGKRLNNPALRVARSIPRFCLLELCSGSCEAEPHCRTNFRGGRRVLLNRRSGEYNSGKIYPRTVANFIIIIPETRVREKKKEETNRNTEKHRFYTVFRSFASASPLPQSQGNFSIASWNSPTSPSWGTSYSYDYNLYPLLRAPFVTQRL